MDITFYLTSGDSETSVSTVQPASLDIDLENITRNDFLHLSDILVALNTSGYGMAYRYGVHRSFLHHSGINALLILHYAKGIHLRNVEMTQEMVNEQAMYLDEMIRSVAGYFIKKHNHIICVQAPIPAWMLDDFMDNTDRMR